MEAVKLILTGVKIDRNRVLEYFPEWHGDSVENAENDTIHKALPVNELDIFFNERKTESARAIEAQLNQGATEDSKGKTSERRNTAVKAVVREHDDATPPDEFEDVTKCDEFRKKHDIRTYSNVLQKIAREQLKDPGVEFEAPIRNFPDLVVNLRVPKWMVRNLTESYEFKVPTPIQMQAIPTLLAGKSLIASAPTGSGKTIAFLVPVLTLLGEPAKKCIRALIVVPSRELASQTLACFDRIKGGKKFKGVLLSRTATEAAAGKKPRIDLCVTAPLKLAQMLKDGLVTVEDCRHVVLDEADKLLDLGFAPQLDFIFSQLPDRGVQVAFFSATLPPRVLELAHSIAPDAVKIAIGKKLAAPSDIEQHLIHVGDEQGKLVTFRSLLADGKLKPPVLLFTSSVDRAKKLFGELAFEGLFVDVMHSDRSASERERLVQGFREGLIWILICSDLMARGVDFKDVNVVLNWDLPTNSETYIHRIGRTGRAGRKGTAYTFYTTEDLPLLPRVLHVMRQTGCEIPQWLPQSKRRFSKPQSNQPKKKKSRN